MTASASSAPTSSAAALCGQNQLQHFLWIFENIAVFIARSAQHLRGQLRRHLDPSDGSIFRHVPNFVDLDAGLSGQRRFQLFRQLAWLIVSAGKCANEPRKVALCGIR